MAPHRSTPRLAEAPDLFAAAPPETAESATGVAGHRLRLRERFLAAGPEALADHEMLEIYTANCAGQDKLTRDGRLQWVRDNRLSLIHI